VIAAARQGVILAAAMKFLPAGLLRAADSDIASCRVPGATLRLNETDQ
jgi:hypothetical protein